jgi:7-cyano-7-deazaguanine synthase
MSRAILLSGGIDSIALTFWLRPQVAITIDYGQRASRAEITASAEICRSINIAHEVIRADCSEIGAGNMCSAVNRASRLVGESPPTPEWWPFRNQLLITLGAATALSRGARELMIGTVSTDRCHLDGTPSFLRLIDQLLRSQEGGLRVSAPAQKLTSAQLVKRSRIPRKILAWAHSCHVGDFACGKCRGCQKHLAVMDALGREEEIGS